MSEPKEQFELFDYDESYDVDSFLQAVDKLEAGALQANETQLIQASDPVVCDPVCLWES